MFDTSPVSPQQQWTLGPNVPSPGTINASQAQAPFDQPSNELDQLNQHFLLVADAVNRFALALQQLPFSA